MRRARAGVLLVAVLCVLVPRPGAAEQLTPEQMERFLEEAKIVGAKPIGKGVTRPWRLTLSDGVVTHDAAFQSVDRKSENARFRNGRHERIFRDYFGYNIAAYRLARLLGCDDLVPVSVERKWRGLPGALTWWIAKKWDEDERLKAGVRPTDLSAWEQQVYRARAFTALLEDTDRNLGNQLVTEDFHLWLIDFTRAFRGSSVLDNPGFLRRIDRSLFERMRALSPKELKAALSPYVASDHAHALVARRDAIVAHFMKIAAERGEQQVFY